MTVTLCHGCQQPCPPPKRHGGLPVKWCSETCRVSSYGSRYYYPRTRVHVRDCTYCARLYVSTSSRGLPCCKAEACRKARKAQMNRAVYEKRGPNPNRSLEQENVWRAAIRERRKAEGLPVNPNTPARVASDQRRRARKRGAMVEKFTPHEVYERDNWTCGICSESVDGSLPWPDPMSVSLDHVIPLAAGGAHSRENTRCTHLGCNVRKGARLEVSHG